MGGSDILNNGKGLETALAVYNASGDDEGAFMWAVVIDYTTDAGKYVSISPNGNLIAIGTGSSPPLLYIVNANSKAVVAQGVHDSLSFTYHDDGKLGLGHSLLINDSGDLYVAFVSILPDGIPFVYKVDIHFITQWAYIIGT